MKFCHILVKQAEKWGIYLKNILRMLSNEDYQIKIIGRILTKSENWEDLN